MSNPNITLPRLPGTGTQPAPILVCFAVKEEEKFFLDPVPPYNSCETLITGMGGRNAGESVRVALERSHPRLVVTSGFAGGLNPELPVGTVIFDAESEAGLAANLLKLGAVAGRFHCSEKVIVTSAEKQALRASTGADAVEMESSVIRALCRERKISSATIRVISDAAGEELPLDFNALMTPEQRINYAKLTWSLLVTPRNIPRLIKFQRQTVFAARQLAEVLIKLLRSGGQ